MKNADQLLTKFKNGEIDSDGEAQLELLRYFQNGFPVENLLNILLDANYETIKIVSFFFAEGGSIFNPICHCMEPFILSEDWRVRYYLVEFAGYSELDDTNFLLKIMFLFRDEVNLVRMRAIQCIARLKKDQFENLLTIFCKNWLIELNFLENYETLLENESRWIRALYILFRIREPMNNIEWHILNESVCIFDDAEMAELLITFEDQIRIRVP